ncbi:YicC/YloC family endoribonuclease [Chlamydiota bacterium]
MKSMTGYGFGEAQSKKAVVTVEIQTINRKHLDIIINAPKKFMQLEQEIRQIISQEVSRGRITAFISITAEKSNNNTYSIDFERASDYYTCLNDLVNELELDEKITLGDLLKNNDIICTNEAEIPIESVKELILDATDTALEKVVETRSQEGLFIKNDIDTRFESINLSLSQIKSLLPVSIQRLKQKYQTTIKELLETDHLNQDRVLTEIGILTEKSDITEELVRLSSHLEQFQNISEEERSCGRPLDFILQEMLREASTMLVKSNDKDMSHLILEIKIELDKIREQIQNIE